MVIVSPQFLGLFPFQMAFHSMAGLNGGDPNYLQPSPGMIILPSSCLENLPFAQGWKLSIVFAHQRSDNLFRGRSTTWMGHVRLFHVCFHGFAEV